MKPEYKVIETHYENLTAYRVVKTEQDDPLMSTVHVYNNERVNSTIGDTPYNHTFETYGEALTFFRKNLVLR